MKRAFFAAVLSAIMIAVVRAAVLRVSEFGGLNTDNNPLFLKNQTPDAENVVTDNGEDLQPRAGFIVFSTESSRNLYSFYTSNGNKYLITQSSNVLKASLGGSTFEITVSTVDPNVTTSISGLGDKLFFCNTTDGLKYWDTSITTTVGSFRPKFLVTHKGRLFMAGVAGDERTIYVSEYLNGANFTLPVTPVDTDPTRLSVQGSLDDILTGLYASFDDKMMWFKQRSFGGILGNRRSNFQSREYSNTVGCAYPDSIRNCNGALRWLGNDRIIYEFDGEKYYPINQDIDSFMDTIEQGDLNLRQWVQTSAADWNSGTIGVGLDTTTVLGDIGLPSTSTTSVSAFLSTGTLRAGGQQDSVYVNASTATRGAYAAMFVATASLQLDKVFMAFYYKSVVAESFQSWVTLHAGATAPSSVVLDTATNRVNATTNITGALTKVATNYYFSQSGSVDKRLNAGTTYWLVMHTTVTALNSVSTSPAFAFLSGSQSFTVPIGVSSITVDIYGAAGSTPTTDSGLIGLGARGGAVHSTISVVTGDLITINIGGGGQKGDGGFNGGGAGGSSRYYGGGASDIRIGGTALANRVIVAGGGGSGGSASSGTQNPFSDGGVGGNPSGQNGQSGDCTGGGGGSQSAGGTAGGGCDSAGVAGSLGQGGAGGFGTGSGGGGYYGGGGGGGATTASNRGGGGGGSSYSLPGGASFVSGVKSGHGASTFTYILHAEFYASEIQSPSLSSTTMLYTSSFTFDGSNYITGNFDSEFQVFFATLTVASTFTTRVFDAGTKFNGWGALGLDDTRAGGRITYTVFADSDTTIDVFDPTTYVAAQQVSDGQTPSIAPDRYITVSAAFDRQQAFSTNTAVLHAITVNFSEGSSIRTFAEFIDNRYWLAIAVSSTANNRVLVFDRDRQYHRYSGINISAVVNYSGTFYFGNANGIYQMEYGTDDNGAPIRSYYRTKTFAPAGADSYATFQRMFVTTVNSSSTLQTQYYVNEVDYAVPMSSHALNSQLGYQNFRLPFQATEIHKGKYISFTWTIESVADWRFMNANLYFDVDPEPQE